MSKLAFIAAALVAALTACSNGILPTPEVIPQRQVITGKPTLLLAGDSRVQMWPTTAFPDYDVTNIGLGGSSTLYSVDALRAQEARYDLIVISVGVNDIGAFLSLSQTMDALDDCLYEASLLSDRVFVTTVPGCKALPGGFPQNVHPISFRAAQINSLLPEVADRHGATVIDLASLLCENWSLKAEYDDGTGMHYTTESYTEIEALYRSYFR